MRIGQNSHEIPRRHVQCNTPILQHYALFPAKIKNDKLYAIYEVWHIIMNRIFYDGETITVPGVSEEYKYIRILLVKKNLVSQRVYDDNIRTIADDKSVFVGAMGGTRGKFTYYFNGIRYRSDLFKAYLESPHHASWFLFIGGQFIGILNVRNLEYPQLRDQLKVVAGRDGVVPYSVDLLLLRRYQKHGIGAGLSSVIGARMRHFGVSYVMLIALKSNRGAKRLMKHIGATKCCTVKIGGLQNNVYVIKTYR